jgi:hypothetical protein
MASENWARQCAEETKFLMEPFAELPSFKQVTIRQNCPASLARDGDALPTREAT